MASKETVPTVKIPSNLGKKRGLTASWASGDRLSVTAHVHKPQRFAGKPTYVPNVERVDIFHLTTDFIFEEPILRSLVAECGNIFLNLQVVRYGQPGAQVDFLKISRMYRSAIRSCLEKLQDTLAVLSEQQMEQYQNYVTILYSIECVWHLVEFLFVDSGSSNAVVVANLLDWVRFHFPTAERMATELLQQGRDADTHESYWPVVKGLIIQGQLSVARALLRMHRNSESVSYEVMDQILQTMPVYSVYGGLSVQKFKSQWQYWSTDAHSKLDAGILSAEPELEELVRLVIGDRKVWADQCRSASCWYEYFPGYLFYTESTCKYYELGTFANNWISLYTSANRSFKYLDNVILSVMENNLHQVLHNVLDFHDNKWFATHIVDLLYHCGQLEMLASGGLDSSGGSSLEEEKNAGKLLRESLLFDFGSLLMSPSFGLWEFGLDYLEYSSTEGLGAREALLSRIPFQSERQAMKLIFLARKNDYPEVEAEISKVMVQRNLATKRYGNALEWAIRSKDATYVHHVADIFLMHYCNHGDIICEDVIANVGAKMFVSPRLIFLVKYYDFRQYYQERSFAQAAELLVSLMDSKIMPSYFWPSLMADAVPLLEFKEPIIPSKETLTILEHLQMDLVPMLQKRQLEAEKEKAQRKRKDIQSMITDVPMDGNVEAMDDLSLIPKFSSNLLNNCSEDLIKLLRLACARNLSRAFVIENTVTN